MAMGNTSLMLLSINYYYYFIIKTTHFNDFELNKEAYKINLPEDIETKRSRITENNATNVGNF